MSDFPTLSKKPDSSKYRLEQEDTAMRTKMEGGYVVSRPRHSRAPRKIFTIGYTNLSDADKVLLENFWDTVKGGSDTFNWTNPIDSVTYVVRFAEPMKFVYVGLGGIHRWDVAGIKLEQA